MKSGESEDIFNKSVQGNRSKRAIVDKYDWFATRVPLIVYTDANDQSYLSSSSSVQVEAMALDLTLVSIL